jgi:hypothetical protein
MARNDGSNMQNGNKLDHSIYIRRMIWERALEQWKVQLKTAKLNRGLYSLFKNPSEKWINEKHEQFLVPYTPHFMQLIKRTFPQTA